MRALLLLLLVGAAFARCPEGMTPIPDDDLERATEIGVEGWSINAQQWCEYFPQAINAYGFEYYNTTVTPYCKSDDGTYHFTIQSKNPCDENKFYVGFMDVLTNSSTCSQTWVETDYFNASTVAAKPFDEANFAPLECKAGFRPAFDDEIEGTATQLLWETVIAPTFQGLTAGQFDDAWYCDESPGYKYINVTGVSACFSKTRDYPPKIQAQGKVQWTCAQQARRRTIELTIESPFMLECKYEVDIQMGDTPEVPQPDSQDA